MKVILTGLIFATYLCQAQIQPVDINDVLVKKKIDSLIKSIIAKQQPDGSWKYAKSRISGATALHVMALVTAGKTEQDPSVKKGVNFLLANFPGNDVYSMGLYATVFQLVDQRKYIKEIKKASDWLCKRQFEGTWNYIGTGRGDNSVTQFALLGIKAAMDAGIEIPPKVLKASQKHFISTQNPNGGWGYSGMSNPSASMTCAALASLAVCELEEEISLELERGPRFCGTYKEDSRIQNGIKWLNNSMNQNTRTIFGSTYTAYACERVGIFFDKKKIGDYDWFRVGAASILNAPNAAGSYLPEAFKLLFIAKGNIPVLFNKVQWGKTADWNRRHRDIRNSTRLLSKTFELKLDWQSVPLDLDNKDFGQAPILYISGLKEFSLKEKERVALKSFVDDGGTILISPCLKSTDFIKSVVKEFDKIYPGAHFEPIPVEHEFRRMFYDLQKQRLPLRMMKNNCNSKRVFLATTDMSLEYEKNLPVKITSYTMANLVKYALKDKPLIGRLDTKKVAEVELDKQDEKQFLDTPGATSEGLAITQILYGPQIDKINPEGMNNALGFMRHSLQIPTTEGINLLSLNDIDEIQKQPVLYMTGTLKYDLNKAELRNLQTYLNNGGFLFADSTCSCSEFDESFKKMIFSIYPEAKFELIPLENPVYQVPFKHEMEFTRELLKSHKPKDPFLLGIRVEDRYIAIYSPLDFSSAITGKLDEQSKGIKSNSALRLITNIISYGLSF